jgi:hypothetical protein
MTHNHIMRLFDLIGPVAGQWPTGLGNFWDPESPHIGTRLNLSVVMSAAASLGAPVSVRICSLPAPVRFRISRPSVHCLRASDTSPLDLAEPAGEADAEHSEL